ncbi:MAG: YfjI family protein [Planctomycetes bacterium]|nr:YfjI family protein [Planctomycetota bacterium]
MTNIAESSKPLNEMSDAEFWDRLPPLEEEAPRLPALADEVEFESLAPNWHPFPVFLLPASLERYVASASESVNVFPEMVAVPLLGGLASVVGNYASFLAMGSWVEPAVLWTTVIAPSGKGKTPAQAAALEFIRGAQKRYIAEYKRAAAEAMQTGGDKPRRKALVTNNTTLEGLTRAIDENPRGVLVEREEIAGLFKAANQYKGGKGCDTEDLLACYDAKPLITTRKGDGSVDVERAAVSITGGIQPGIARRLLSKNDSEFIMNGMAARLMMSLPPERKRRKRLPAIDEKAKNNAGLVFHRLLSLMPEAPIGESPPPPRMLAFSDSALSRLDGLLDRTAALRQILDTESPLLMALPKIEGAAIRLAGILHLARWLDPERKENVNPDVIDDASALAGAGVAAWFLREARRVYALFGQAQKAKDDPNDLVAKVDKFITERGGKAKLRDIQRRYFQRDCVEYVRTWLYEHYVAAERAALENIGKSWRIVMFEPVAPELDDEDDDAPVPAQIACSVETEAPKAAASSAEEISDTPIPVTEPHEIEPGLFDYGDGQVDMRPFLRKIKDWFAALSAPGQPPRKPEPPAFPLLRAFPFMEAR